MSNPSDQTLQMLHVTADGIATAVRIPSRGPDALQRLVGGLIQGVAICGELAFYASRTAAEDREPNPFVFDIISGVRRPDPDGVR